MSLADLLPAIRALPRAEKAELIHLLVDDVSAPPAEPARDVGLTDEQLREMFPPGYVAQVWFPGPNPEAVAAATRALAEYEAKRE
jgi:hypothetical protein